MAKVVMVKGEPVLRDDWHIEDIVMVAEELDEDLSREEIEQIMHLMARAHDANIGINWEVIQNAIETFVREKVK